MTLPELVEWEGAPLDFAGFSWDYGGMLFLNQNSKLANMPLQISLCIDYRNNTNTYDALMGDVELNSNDPEVQNAPIIVEYLTYKP
jgi:hypothetical protein